MKSLAKFVSAVGIFVVSTVSLSIAAEKSVWKIGAFDQSSNEFRSHDVAYSDPKTDPVYRVGSSRDSVDWLRFQPGPANGMTGGREHPFTIVFNLPTAPKGLFRLKIAMLHETPRMSHLRLNVNGKSGLFYFHPTLNYAAGDWEGTFVPQTSMDTKFIEIPAEWLRAGENRFVLTALDEPATVENSLGSIAPGHSGIVYDALELLNDTEGRYDAAKVEAKIVPTIFYRGSAEAPKEVVDTFITYGTMPAKGSVRLEVDGAVAEQSFTSSEQFGERRIEFEIPAWEGEQLAKVTVGGGAKEIAAKVSPAKRWTVYIIPHEHLDVGFTDYPARVAELHSESLDGAMETMKKVPEFRWTTDGFWVAEQFFKGRSEQKQQELLQHIRDGKIAVPMQYSNQHTGNASWEGLAHSLYDAYYFAKKHSIPQSESAQTVDVPAYTWAYASVLHDAGIKYFVGASNSWRAPIMLLGRWNERSPFYWEGPDGSRVMMWYSRAYLQMHTLFAGPWRMAAVRDSLPIFLQAYTRPDYKANSAIVFGSQLENTPLAKEQANLPGEWRKQYVWPKIEFATVTTAMKAIEREAGGDFPVVRGDFGPYWEDGFGSDSFYTGLHRNNQSRVLTAEKMGVIPSLLRSEIRPDRTLLQSAWNNLLVFDEHTWTYVGATSQPEHQQSEDQIELKRARAKEAARQIDESVQRSWGQIASLIAPRENSLVVFNALNWNRNAVVSFDLQDGQEIAGEDGKAVPYEVVRVGKGFKLPGFGGGYKRVRFEAKDLPAMGYRTYRLRTATEPATQNPATAKASNVIENQFYRITIDAKTAGIRSIFDKTLNRELVDASSPYAFGSYLYVTGGDDIPNNSLYRYGASLKPPKLTVHPATGGKLVEVVKTPFGTRVVMQSASVNTPSIRTEITLRDSEKKIEIRYEVQKNRVLSRESAYFAFPFRASKPRFAYGSQAGWIDPAKDELPGGSREWHVVTHWAGIEEPGFAAAIAPVDAPLVAFGDIVRGNWPSEFKPVSSGIFSWVLNNYWGTNFQAWQGGTFTYRYVLTSDAKLKPAKLVRFGMESMTLAESAQVPATKEPTYLPEQKASLVSLDNPNVVISTWKNAEEGEGSILRLAETSGIASRVKVSSPYLKFVRAQLCSLQEEPRQEIPATADGFEVELKPFQVVTVRVNTAPSVTAKHVQE